MTPVDELVAERAGIPLSLLTQEKLEEYQLAKLREVLFHVKEHSDYYREKLAGIMPESIRTMEDFRTLPDTCEADLAGAEWRFQCVPHGKVSRIVTVPTTGTGGKSKRLSFSEQDLENAAAFINRGFMTMHCREGERMLIFMSGGSPGSIGDQVRKAMKPLGMEIDVYGPVRDIRYAYEYMLETRPAVIEGIPWHMAALARYGERYGNPESAFIRSVNLSADTVPESVVQRLKKLWDCTVHIHYGMTEMCIFGGVECECREGIHLRGSDMIYEIPDPDENGCGEILITTLDRDAMPLIRYRTGDIGRMTDEPCGCGCRLRRIERIFGRKSDTVSIKDGRTWFTMLAGALYAIPAVIDFDAELCTAGADKGSKGTDAALYITVRTLPGDRVEKAEVVGAVMGIPSLGPELCDGENLYIFMENTEAFPDGYNLKKKVRRTLREA